MQVSQKQGGGGGDQSRMKKKANLFKKDLI